jgi:hypothetical protein
MNERTIIPIATCSRFRCNLPDLFDPGGSMELFRAEKFGDIEGSDDSLRECCSCDNKLRLVSAVYYPETEETIRVFGCDCGERTWDE